MLLSILYFGDIVGSPGREAVAAALPGLRSEFDPDLVLANIENATHGRGVLKRHYDELKAAGIDAFSSGDHIWKFKEFINDIGRPELQLVRPANYPQAPGKRFLDLNIKGKRVRLINLLGRTFMGGNVDSPFLTFDAIAKELPAADLILVDFHAEATSEKRALAEYIGGRAQLIVGTHTHVPTADAQILPNGAAFISDLGMCGPTDSSLGAEKNEAMRGFLTGLPWHYNLAEGECELGAIYAEIDFETKTAQRIEHIRRFSYSNDK